MDCSTLYSMCGGLAYTANVCSRYTLKIAIFPRKTSIFCGRLSYFCVLHFIFYRMIPRFFHFRLARICVLWYKALRKASALCATSVWSRGVRVAQEILILFVLVRIQARLSHTEKGVVKVFTAPFCMCVVLVYYFAPAWRSSSAHSV